MLFVRWNRPTEEIEQILQPSASPLQLTWVKSSTHCGRYAGHLGQSHASATKRFSKAFSICSSVGIPSDGIKPSKEIELVIRFLGPDNSSLLRDASETKRRRMTRGQNWSATGSLPSFAPLSNNSIEPSGIGMMMKKTNRACP
jgi:hypothetical protein